ncbi:dihydrodipicolinate reductase C-terminal domain-containing protein, partial [Bacillus sp. S1-R4H1-FB]|uniref:dihydrodipicolinate reductase C-terminal domain-containing protein n=1 Tax=Bacillus sp. S1-R4H1-FB TaxID=1973492 RepID=UPI0027152097
VDVSPSVWKISDLLGMPAQYAPMYGELSILLEQGEAVVLLALTTTEVSKQHVTLAVERGLRSGIGTTVFTEEELKQLTETAKEKAVGTIIAPNFAIGAVLMMKFSQMAAKYFQDVEVIELNTDTKLDAPSGTAVNTVELIRQNRKAKPQ